MENISTEYNMIETLQNISRSFFPTDISTERLGTFGFIAEGMANIYGAAILDANMRASEYYTAKARRMDTLLAEAETLGVVIDKTTPAIMNAYLAIPTSGIKREENSELDARGNITYYFVLEKDTEININGYQFMLEWDILITAKQVGGKYVYSAQYLTEGSKDPHNNDMCSGKTYGKEPTLSVLQNPYIQISLVKSAGDSSELVMLRVNLRQMQKKYDYYVVSETDMISLTGLEFTYDDYLCNFNVFYRETQNNEWEYIHPISIYDNGEYDEKTIQYSINRDDKTITFNATKFTPKYNAEFRIDIYTTKGSFGNITYNGDGSDISVELKSYEDRHIYSGIEMICTPITPATGGLDTVGLEEVRAKVIRAKASHKSLNSDYDIENFLREYDLINDYFTIKRRSDILETIYSAFTILRMPDSDIIPTSTVDLIVDCKNADGIRISGTEDPEDADIQYMTIKAGTPFIPIYSKYSIGKDSTGKKEVIPVNTESKYMGGTETNDWLNKVKYLISNVEQKELPEEEYKFISTNLTYSDTDTTEKKIEGIIDLEKYYKIFALPFTIVYDVENQLASMYMSSIDKDVTMSQEPLTKETKTTGTNFAIDHINISRDSIHGEDKYHMEVAVMASGDYSNCYKMVDGVPATDEDGAIIINNGERKNTLMVKGFLYENGAENKIEYYFDFDFVSHNDGIFIFETDIPVTDSINMHTGKLSLPMQDLSDNSSIYSIDYPNIDETIKKSETGTNADLYRVLKYYTGTGYIDINNLKIGLGVYYIKDQLDDSFTIENPSTRLTGESNGNKVRLDNDGYPMFMRKSSKTISGTTKEYKNIEYELTDVYLNTSDLIDLYVDMSYVTRCSTIQNKVTGSDISSVYFQEVPILQYSKAIDREVSDRVTEIIRNTKDVLDEMNLRLNNSFSVDYKFFRTYGPCKYFKLEKTFDANTEVDLNDLDIRIEFNCRLRPGVSATDSEITSEIKPYLKKYIETLNESSDYTMYMSNILTELETKFKNTIRSIELVSLNGQNEFRVIMYDKPEIENYQYSNTADGREKLRYFIPEYVNLPIENITINILR